MKRLITCVLEHEEKLIKEASRIAEEQKKAAEEKKDEPRESDGLHSVSIGNGVGEIFRELGVDYLIEGGQTMNKHRGYAGSNREGEMQIPYLSFRTTRTLFLQQTRQAICVRIRRSLWCRPRQYRRVSPL